MPTRCLPTQPVQHARGGWHLGHARFLSIRRSNMISITHIICCVTQFGAARCKMELNKFQHDPKVAKTSKVRILFEEIIFIALFIGVATNQNAVVQNQRHFLSKPV